MVKSMVSNILYSLVLSLFISLMACSQDHQGSQRMAPSEIKDIKDGNNMEQEKFYATFGAGCFWCVEAIFERIAGVSEVAPGYCGGTTEHPSYKDVCAGIGGHAEVCRITYDPRVVSFAQLLEIFWKTHDPTTINRQGNDVGVQYRSVIFYHDAEQQKIAEEFKEKLNAAQIWEGPIVTEIVPVTKFFPAEEYHHDYFRRNPAQPYCRMLIGPKVEKLEKTFHKLLKKK